nr:hypothetical protein [Methylomarinum sp. Ch1-1]MDP4522833.1 hypothetical protein [Methylomarinum sp. Ch1-1]
MAGISCIETWFWCASYRQHFGGSAGLDPPYHTISLIAFLCIGGTSCAVPPYRRQWRIGARCRLLVDLVRFLSSAHPTFSGCDKCRQAVLFSFIHCY